MRPRSTTTTSSAFSAVDIRCAMVTEVRPRHQALEAAADPHLERGVDRAGGLVEDQQVGVGEVGAQQRDQLPLPRRQRLAALADLGVEAARAAPASQSPRPSSSAAGEDRRSSVGVEPAVAHVGRERCRRTGSPPAAPAPRCAAATPAAISRTSIPSSSTAPCARVHQPGEQLGEGRLARAGLADDRDAGCPARCRGRRRAAPAGRRGRRTSTPSNSTSIGPRGSTAPSGPGVDQVGRGVEDADHPAPAGDGVLGVGEDLGAHLHRADEQRAPGTRRRGPCRR